jgi:hypothetical protein
MMREHFSQRLRRAYTAYYSGAEKGLEGAAQLRAERATTDEAFYHRAWTVHEIQMELRYIAHDLEFARKAQSQYAGVFHFALEQEIIESEGDLKRKVQFLSQELQRLDSEEYVRFADSMELVELNERLGIVAEIVQKDTFEYHSVTRIRQSSSRRRTLEIEYNDQRLQDEKRLLRGRREDELEEGDLERLSHVRNYWNDRIRDLYPKE